jgi:hypothetical protein
VNEKVFKYLAVFLGIIVLWSFCSKPKKSSDASYDVNVQTLVSASEGLDLKAVGELLKKAKDGETFEKLLNSKSEGINNLDLDEDGKVDYISVTEYGNDKMKGFSLTVETGPNEVQEVATIEIEKQSDQQGQMQITGNQQIYGANHHYHSGFGLTDFLIMSWLFSSRPFYSSPWHYGAYPGYYSPYSTVPNTAYRSNMNNRTRSTSFRQSSSRTMRTAISSPNRGKTATNIKAPLKNPTASQKSFQARNPSKQVKSGGFGRRSSSTSNRATSVRRSSSSRSGGFSRGK